MGLTIRQLLALYRLNLINSMDMITYSQKLNDLYVSDMVKNHINNIYKQRIGK